MSKIPKNLTDKDMLKNWVEEETVEDKFLRAEKIEDKKRRERAGIEPPAELARAGLTRQLTEELGKALTELKMQLSLKGAKDITYKVKNDGTKIVITPKYTL
ncbi:MAG: hypothetical protein MSA50_02795 [Veillonellaceae bacterium]|jgi:hypothetical protein|uniref:hypothetical protein n=1 Tax=uncultured Selenomonas sp. TaxID=159275 RepID=UPI0025E89139|nr:hypothetical protein [uncultured Selenomonas sp.]MCI7539509.1 hypothetical protein [Veillonellaceae bacterium]MDD6128062.1 hypothetical protein [Veillonellaceae bacterium]MDD6696796.1 hypothetical protein [Veillonellaceae bacterium]MDY6350069.1 hypothetical protein [Selenomonas sp.]